MAKFEIKNGKVYINGVLQSEEHSQDAVEKNNEIFRKYYKFRRYL